ncbi:hypothetical protein FXO37_17208 [Capsicum annuum]|nr:hypothetical protein FXO37_17208 [Capsicum annuum]
MGSTNQDEDDAIIRVVAISILASGVAIIVAYKHENSILREPYINKDQEREFYMNSVLNESDVHCVGQIRMSKHMLYELCIALRRNSFLCSTKNMSNQEQVMIFLEIVGFNEQFQKIRSYFYRSIDSIHRCFHTVLQAVLKLYPILIKSPDGSIQLEIMNNHRYYPWFTVHPNHDKFINKKIKMFDEMSLVCGNDWARGDYAKSFEDIDFDSFSEKDNDSDLEGPFIEKNVQVTEASQIKASRKRKHFFEVQNVIGDISIKFREVATVIGRMVNSRLDVTKLYEKVMAMKGYKEEFLGDAFDYLVQSNTLAKALMVKNQNLPGKKMKMTWKNQKKKLNKRCVSLFEDENPTHNSKEKVAVSHSDGDDDTMKLVESFQEQGNKLAEFIQETKDLGTCLRKSRLS